MIVFAINHYTIANMMTSYLCEALNIYIKFIASFCQYF